MGTPIRGEDPSGEGGSATGEPWTEGQFTGAETGDGGTPSNDGDAVLCESVPGVLRRPGCPERPPPASDCLNEGLLCLYASEDDGCFVEWECLLGLWSPRGESCHADTAADPKNDAACSSYVPVAGEPCTEPGEGVPCWYGFCPTAGYREVKVTCECFRSVVDWYGCPTER